MSGGCFDYICFDVEDEGEILKTLDTLKDVEEFLRGYEKHDAADEVLQFRKDLETYKRILLKLGKRINPILYAAEWWASGDWGEDGFDEEWRKFLGGE